MSLLVGQFLGDYYLSEHIGRGGYADVYRCEHKSLKIERAIKVAKQPDKKSEQLFLNEIQLHTQLHHPAIIQTYEAGEMQSTFFLVMDFIPHGSLERLAGQQIELSIIIPCIKQIASALHYLHQKHIVHCDVKPGNFLLRSNNHILLSDFGIAVVMGQPITDVYGTLEYVSPERFQRKPCPESDQYALAITAYEWLTGECPFVNLNEVLHKSPPSLLQKRPSLSQEIEHVVFKALEKQPQQRYADVLAFATALEKAYLALQGPSLATTSPATPTSPTPSTPPSPTPSTPPLTPALSALPPLLKVVSQHTRKLGQPIIATPAPETRVLGRKKPGVAQSHTLYRKHNKEVVALAWSPDGSKLVSSDLANRIHIWNALDGSTIATHSGYAHMILNLMWSPDGLCIATADEIQAVQFWDVKTGQKGFRYHHRVGNPGEVGIGLYYPMAWSRDGRFMISASDDQPLEKWDTTTGNRSMTYRGHDAQIKTLGWSPDERWLAAAGGDKTVHVWDAMSGDIRFVYQKHRTSVYALTWSADSKRVASASLDGFVHVWNALDGEDVFIYRGHNPRSVKSLAWSPDGKKIASAGSDHRIHIWNALTGETLAIYNEHHQPITALAWSPTAEYLASASDDGTARVWKVEV